MLPALYMYITRIYKKRVDGTKGYYYVLYRSYWDYIQKRQKNKYLAYLGTKPEISEEKAKQIATKLGISLDELRKVKKLTILLE